MEKGCSDGITRTPLGITIMLSHSMVDITLQEQP